MSEKLLRAPDAACPVCGTLTKSDGVTQSYARSVATVDMTYTCQRCQRLFLKSIRTAALT